MFVLLLKFSRAKVKPEATKKKGRKTPQPPKTPALGRSVAMLTLVTMPEAAMRVMVMVMMPPPHPVLKTDQKTAVAVSVPQPPPPPPPRKK